MLMLLAAAQIYSLVVLILDMQADRILVERAARLQIGDLEHGVARADDVERRIEDVCRNGHGFLRCFRSSFRDGPKDQARNVEIPDSMLRIAPKRQDSQIPSFWILCVPRASETCLVSM